MLKAIWCVTRDPRLSLAEFSQHWFEVHGPLHIQPGHKLLGYDQHHTLMTAYDSAARPTHDGASIVWLENIEAYEQALTTKAFQDAVADGNGGVRGHIALLGWPLGFAMGREQVLLPGDTNAMMVKIIHVVRHGPTITSERFFDHWANVSAPIAMRLPGIRRYVQVHGIAEAPGYDERPYDGWSEAWFDSFDHVLAAINSAEWQQLERDGREGVDGEPLYDSEHCLVIGRERHILPPVVAE